MQIDTIEMIRMIDAHERYESVHNVRRHLDLLLSLSCSYFVPAGSTLLVLSPIATAVIVDAIGDDDMLLMDDTMRCQRDQTRGSISVATMMQRDVRQ